MDDRQDDGSRAARASFGVGDVVHHRKFGYRGVVVDVDPEFRGTEAWYQAVARSRPPKDKPWYHVLPHGMTHRTYVAERHLEADATGEPIEHPDLAALFADRGRDGRYRPRERRH